MSISLRGMITRYALCAAGLVGVTGVAGAQSAQDFYKGKSLTIDVGSTAGGSYDVTSRLLARHIINYLPGVSSIIIRNVPGAGSLTSVLSLDNSAAKDGTTLTAFNPGLFGDSMAAGDAAAVKLSNYAFIGSVMRDFRTCYAWSDSKIASWEDLTKQTGIVFGATGVKANSYIGASMLKNLFDINLRIIPAYPGNREMWLSMEQGEVTAACSSWVGMPDDWLKARKINILVKLIDGAPDGVPPNVPYIGDIAKTQEQKDVVDFLMAPAVLGRPFIVSKAVPPDRIALLREAFDNTMRDRRFIEDARKQEIWVDPISGVEAQKLVEKLYSFPAATVARAGKVLN